MKPILRAYQSNIVNSILTNGNTLVVLPTGLGKTLIAFQVIKEKTKYGKKALFMAPTKPLVQQHYRSFLELFSLDSSTTALVTGSTPPAKRQEEYKKQFIFATPQTIRNDLKRLALRTNDFVVAIFDEAHRAVGDYAYSEIAKQLPKETLIVGLTASPGGRKARILEVLNTLSIINTEIRIPKDEDVFQYIKPLDIKWVKVDLSPHLLKIKTNLEKLIAQHTRKLASLGFPPPLRSKKNFLELRAKILNTNHPVKYPALVHYSILLHLLHSLELAETQGVYALRKYIENLQKGSSKSKSILLKEPAFREVAAYANSNEEHPKLKLLIDLLKKLTRKKVIVFAQYRNQIDKIINELTKNGISARKFVGKKDGFTKKQQEETIADFRLGTFQTLVASSIGEEGLDIPAVDAVIFFEPVPSEIRSIQRRGRAGRFKKGEVYILITKNTRDEYFYWASFNREAKMKSMLKSIQKNKTPSLQKILSAETPPMPHKKGQSSLADFF